MKIPTLHFPKFSPIIVIGIIVGLLFAASLATGGYFYKRAVNAEAIIKDPQKLGKEEAKKVIEEVLKLMELPKDEEPTIATVADAEKLKDQEFFRNSQNGDKVLVYTKARKAILYRSATNKIIDVAPVTLGDANQQAQPTGPEGEIPTTPTQPQLAGKVTILNGTGIVGITKKVEDSLKAAFPGITIGERDNAKGKAYQKTIVVDVKGANPDLARGIAQNLQASLSVLPEGEATPTADIVIIVGEDKK